jgi:uncharacterized alkaline shock family protein YloU
MKGAQTWTLQKENNAEQKESFVHKQLPEDSQVRPKYVADDCDFNVILNYGNSINRDELKTEANVKSDISMQQDTEIQYSNVQFPQPQVLAIM